MPLQLGEHLANSRSRLFKRSTPPSSAVNTESSNGQLDSALIFSLGNVGRAAEVLVRPDVSGTTRREVMDRVFRSVGNGALHGKVSYDVFASVEDQARSFYTQFHANGVNTPVELSGTVLSEAGKLDIEQRNRNLAAAFWEPRIRGTITEVTKVVEGKAKPTIVSLAFGGNEPALLLSGIRKNSPITHMKIMPDGAAHYLSPDLNNLIGADLVVVEDTVKSGSTMHKAVSALHERFQPNSVTTIVVHSYNS